MINKTEEKFVDSFLEQNKEEGIRVFVAGGSREGDDPIYAEEAYKLGQKIIKMGFKLDFGLSNKGIMGAVARGVVDGWNQKTEFPISAVTTKEYLTLYPNDDELIHKISDNLTVAETLEERKHKLLEADFVVFAPGGVGTLDELAYDLVAMQDGFLSIKPIIIYNVDGFFHHLLEFLKEISAKAFADPIPFMVVDNSDELGIVFRLIKLRYQKGNNNKEAYGNARQLIYELPYFIQEKTDSSVHVEYIIEEMQKVSLHGSAEERQVLANEIENAYLEKEIQRMYKRMEKVAKDTAIVSGKLADLKKRRIKNC